MICFLTSAADIHGEDRLNPANGFIDELRGVLKCPCRTLFICSDPGVPEVTDFYAAQLRGFMAAEGLLMSSLHVLDGRNAHIAAELLAESDLVILSGGHVPTQNRFFRQINLRELIKGFDGVLISISAGTMNSAGTVYAMPELPGEAVDPDFQRTLTGLGLTDINVIPHYQYLRTVTFDGMEMPDIALEDSMGRRLYAINDGSYIFIKDGVQELRGEALLIEKGSIQHICSDGESVIL